MFPLIWPEVTWGVFQLHAEKAKSMRENTFDVIPLVAKFAFLAEGQRAVRPKGQIFSTPGNVHFPSRNP